MMVQTFLRYNSLLVYDGLLTETLSMHKWDYNHRRSWLLWSFIQYTPLLQGTSWHFFQDSLSISSLTNDALVDCRDGLFSAVFSIFRRFLSNRTIAFGVSALSQSRSLEQPLWALLPLWFSRVSDMAVRERTGVVLHSGGALFHSWRRKEGWLYCPTFISFKRAELFYFPHRYNNY